MTIEKAQIETLLTAMYGSLNKSLTKNYPAKMYLGSMINQSEWMGTNKEKDAAEKIERIQSMNSNVIATESAEDGRVVHNPSGTAAIGSRNHSVHNVNELMAYCERDEQEADCHHANSLKLRAIYKDIFKEAYRSKKEKQEASMPASDVNKWLAKRAS